MRKVYGRTAIMQIAAFCLIVLAASSLATAQRRRSATAKPADKPRTIVFAVKNDGNTLEPIAEIAGGKLVATTGGDSDEAELNKFVADYYKPKTAYNLVFAGIKDGTVTVTKGDSKSDCGKNMAEATTTATKAKLKGMVMALATNDPLASKASGTRRLPTAAERTEVEALVRAAYAKNKVSAAAIKNMKYHNLTALDVNNDGNAELVGSFITATSKNEKALLFFIAEKAASGKYAFVQNTFQRIAAKDLMGGAEIESLATDGVLNELLLDVMDVNGDGTAEIFTMTEGFESAGFNVYGKNGGKWTRVFEGSNYHCGF